MYAECPHCQALYRITPAELQAANGWVRCGECGHVFEANETLSAPEEPPLRTSSADAGSFASASPAASGRRDSTAPRRHAATARKPRGGSTLLWSLAILVLIALLGAQYLLSQRDQLAKYPELRPLLTQLCRLRGCTLPPRRDLADIALTSRNIFTHPNLPHALMVTATLVNNAPFPQPYPVLQISFSNLEGKTVALGRFTPAQYLPKGVDPKGLMPVAKPVHLSFSVNDPGQQALAYEFDFR